MSGCARARGILSQKGERVCSDWADWRKPNRCLDSGGVPRGRAGLTAFGSVGVLVKASKKPTYNLGAVADLKGNLLAEHSEVLAQVHELRPACRTFEG